MDQMDVYPELVGPLLHYCSRIQISDFLSLELFLHKDRPTKAKSHENVTELKHHG